jgi:hypothetical protein
MKRKGQEDLEDENGRRAKARRFGNQAVTVSEKIASIDFSRRFASRSDRKALTLPLTKYRRINDLLERGPPSIRLEADLRHEIQNSLLDYNSNY